ncbi:hypothetical protein HOG16_01235 [Candidatus Woesearchaeota archaeon]|jgi:hypothetical protein|nr:hypothetical protein [Candidatus Woesearchaeota archaeon]MBT4321707.1 hypothetical protein [Candidatus Woesearchaeota archaeon]MBT4630709.1 hypothetical protein [Candidatus Woesearchaeota archaeon]
MGDVFLIWIIIYLSCVISSVTSVILSKVINVGEELKISSIFYYASISLLISGLVGCVVFLLYAIFMLFVFVNLGSIQFF